jgi:hypothetical protein
METAEHDGYGQAFVDKLIDVVQQMKMRPREIRVKRDIAYRLYEDIAAKLGIPIRQVPKLSVIEGIQKELAGFLGKR